MSIFKWLGRRAQEPSTYSGAGMVVVGAATMIGKPELGTVVTGVIEVVAPILLTLGGVLIGKPKHEADERTGLAIRTGR